MRPWPDAGNGLDRGGSHELGHDHGHHDTVNRRAEIIEILEAILLAVVAVATAWSGYQTARWDGRQAHEYGLTNKYRALSNQAATRSGQEELYDTSTFVATYPTA